MNPAISNISLNDIGGNARTLREYDGKVLLVVNVASKCGLTPQYEGLEKLYRDKHGRGPEVLGFPANDFAGQEPGTEAEIASFCSTTYDVTFPMFSKIAVTGDNTHPLYRELILEAPPIRGDADDMRAKLVGYGIVPNPAPGVLWNFEKFLLSRDGRVAARFAPSITPDDPALLEAIDAELAKGWRLQPDLKHVFERRLRGQQVDALQLDHKTIAGLQQRVVILPGKVAELVAAQLLHREARSNLDLRVRFGLDDHVADEVTGAPRGGLRPRVRMRDAPATDLHHRLVLDKDRR
jgi:glutathione peroxidase